MLRRIVEIRANPGFSVVLVNSRELAQFAVSNGGGSRFTVGMNGSEFPFIKYVQGVDETLEAFYGRTAGPEDFEFLLECQEMNVPPETAALRLGSKRVG